MLQSKRDLVYIILAGIFITNAIFAELIGGKLIDVFGVPMSLGILPWPIVFITTDLINEYFGTKGVRRLSIITAGLIIYCFLMLFIGMRIPANSISPVTDEQFNAVFGQSQWIIVGSITAFLTSQLIDVSIFHFVKNKTGNKMIWLRSTGSTVISQLVDSFVVLGIAFYLTGKMTLQQYIASGIMGYSVKLVIAILFTPLIYLGHNIISNYLKEESNSQKNE